MNFLDKIKTKLKEIDDRASLGQDIKTVHYAPKNSLLIPITLKNGRQSFKQK